MKQFIIVLVMLIVGITSFAKPGDTVSITKEQIVEWSYDTITTSNGKQKNVYYVIFTINGKRKIAYMTKSDYDIVNKAMEKNLDLDYIIIELKSKLKLTVK